MKGCKYEVEQEISNISNVHGRNIQLLRWGADIVRLIPVCSSASQVIGNYKLMKVRGFDLAMIPSVLRWHPSTRYVTSTLQAHRDRGSRRIARSVSICTHAVLRTCTQLT